MQKDPESFIGVFVAPEIRTGLDAAPNRLRGHERAAIVIVGGQDSRVLLTLRGDTGVFRQRSIGEASAIRSLLPSLVINHFWRNLSIDNSP